MKRSSISTCSRPGMANGRCVAAPPKVRAAYARTPPDARRDRRVLLRRPHADGFSRRSALRVLDEHAQRLGRPHLWRGGSLARQRGGRPRNHADLRLDHVEGGDERPRLGPTWAGQETARTIPVVAIHAASRMGGGGLLCRGNSGRGAFHLCAAARHLQLERIAGQEAGTRRAVPCLLLQSHKREAVRSGAGCERRAAAEASRRSHAAVALRGSFSRPELRERGRTTARPRSEKTAGWWAARAW